MDEHDNILHELTIGDALTLKLADLKRLEAYLKSFPYLGISSVNLKIGELIGVLKHEIAELEAYLSGYYQSDEDY